MINTSNIKRIIKRFVDIFPPGNLKNQIYYIIWLFKKKNFKVAYENGYFEITLDNVIIRLNDYEGIGLYKILRDGYLRNYSLKAGDTVIDLGAYVGAFTIYAAKKVGNSGKIVAFEPDATSFKKLIKNIKLNNLDNIIAINKGVWSNNTILKFNIRPFGGSSIFLEDDTSCKDVFQLPLVSLDEELKEWKIEKVDFIKMDIEGAEIEALKGGENILRNNRANLAIASYHIVNGEQTSKVLEKLLDEIGYNHETAFPEHLTTYASRKD